MKRWLAIATLLGLAIVGWSVPRGARPGGCITEYFVPDSVLFLASSCDPTVNDTIRWPTSYSPHKQCSVRVKVNLDTGLMVIGKADCVQIRGVDQRYVYSPSPEVP